MSIDFKIGDLVSFDDKDSDFAEPMIGIVLDIVSDEEMSDTFSEKERIIFEAILGSDEDAYFALPSFTIHSCMCLVSWFPIKKETEDSLKPLTLWVPCDYISKLS